MAAVVVVAAAVVVEVVVALGPPQATVKEVTLENTTALFVMIWGLSSAAQLTFTLPVSID